MEEKLKEKLKEFTQEELEYLLENPNLIQELIQKEQPMPLYYDEDPYGFENDSYYTGPKGADLRR